MQRLLGAAQQRVVWGQGGHIWLLLHWWRLCRWGLAWCGRWARRVGCRRRHGWLGWRRDARIWGRLLHVWWRLWSWQGVRLCRQGAETTLTEEEAAQKS